MIPWTAARQAPLFSSISQSLLKFTSIRLLRLPGASDSRESAMLETQAPGLGRSPGEENSYPLQYSCLECSMDRRARRATVHAVTRAGHDWATNTFTLKLLPDPPRSPALQADSLPSEPPGKPIIWSIISKSHSVHLPSNVLYPPCPWVRAPIQDHACHDLLVSFNTAKFLILSLCFFTLTFLRSTIIL